MKKNYKTGVAPILISLISFLILGIGLFVFYYYQNSIKTKTFLLPKPTANPSASGLSPSLNPKVTASSSALPTAVSIPEGWSIFTSNQYNFTLSYPDDWQAGDQGRHFSEGSDLLYVFIVGPTQREQTEFYDGAFLAAGQPLAIGQQSIEVWAKNYYGEKNIDGEPNEFSNVVIGSHQFYKIYACGLGCFNYYNILKDGLVYRFVTFAEGKNKQQYQEALNIMLTSLTFFN
jgi:hypothetical protein